MNHLSFDALTRRGSLLTAGAAGLAALANPISAGAKQNARKRTARKARRKCKQQVGECLAFFEVGCEGDFECLALAEACCPDFGRCDPGGFLTCLLPQI